MSLKAPTKCDSDAQELLAHLLNVRAVSARDPRTGEPLAQSLHEYLRAVYKELIDVTKPVPEDLLMVCVRLSLDAVRNIVGHPRYRLLRKRKLLPPHKADEVDASSLMWLARQPGRNNREKLATRNRMMAVDREVSLNTAENRLLVRFVRYIEPLLSARLQERDTYDKSPESSARLAMIEELHELCSDILSGRVMEDIEPSLDIQPNNAMLSDPNYNLIWRAFNFLRVEPRGEPIATEAIMRTLFLGALAMLVAHYGAQCCEQLIRADAGIGDESMGLAVGSPNGCGEMIATTVLLPLSRGSNKCRGVVSEVIESAKATFGLICEEGCPRKIWFSPRCLSQGFEWTAITRGAVVNYQKFEGDKGPVASGVMPAGPPIRALLMRQKPSCLHLSLCEWTHNGEAQTFQTTVDIGLTANGNFLATLSGKYKEERTCDLTFPGIMAVVESICVRGAGLVAQDKKDEPSIDYHTSVDGVGIDVSGAAVECRVDGMHVPSCPELFGVRHPALSPALQACFKGYVYDPWSGSAEYVSLSSLWRPSSSSETRSAAELARCFCEQLKTHLTLTDESRLAVAVPDDADDFTLRPLLDNLEVSYPERVGVIRRSVAAGLAWQQSTGYAGADIRPGDVLLVVDVGGPSLCTTPLVARGDSRLDADSSRGVLWERRPSYIPEEWDESTAYRSLLMEYAMSAVQFHGCEVSSSEALASTLVEVGVIHLVLREGISRFVPIGARYGGGVLEVPFVPATWQRICEKWVVSMRTYLACWGSRNGPLADLLAGVLGRRNRVTLLLSLPDAMRDAIGSEWKANVSRSLPQDILVGPACYMDRADAQLAVGAQIAARRLAKNIPVCIEWMPELSLEVVKDGHFGLLPIFTENTVTASLGQSVTCAVEEDLILKAGSLFYEFPLLQGRTGQKPLQYLARLQPLHRLEQDLPVRLTVRFAYGTNRYMLTANPSVPGSIAASELTFSWMREGRPASLISPPFPPSVELLEQDRTELIAWLTRACHKLSSVCRDAFECQRISDETASWFTAWLAKAFELPVRRLWLGSTRLQDIPEPDRDVCVESFAWLLRITGATDEGKAMVWPDNLLPGKDLMQRDAIRILTRTRMDCPPALVSWLASVCHDKEIIGRDVWQDGIGRILALETVENEQLRGAVFDVFRVSCTGETFDPKQAAAIREATAKAMWSSEEAAEIINRSPGVDLRSLLMNTEQDLHGLAYRVRGLSPTDWRLRSIAFSFSHHCMIILALLRLAASDQKWRDAISARSQRLVRFIRTADAAFAEKHIQVMSPLRFDLQKPSSLSRMSDIAFATTAFLSGDTKCTLAVVSMAEEDQD